MSTQNRPLIVGLVSPGLFWLAASVAHGQGTPSPRGLPTTRRRRRSATLSVLLMSNGTVVQGEIADDPAGGVYRLKTRGGQVPYPKSSVKRAGRSIQELYRYQVAALPPGDPDERMKLVRWCLTEHLQPQAREQLTDVLKLSPEDPEAVADGDEPRRQRPRTATATPSCSGPSGEMPRGDAPATLDPGIVKRLRKGFGNSLARDLRPAPRAGRPSGLGVRRVRPARPPAALRQLSQREVSGDFQLVQVRNLRDRQNPDIARANLDAALRLVNPDDPARSDLLSAGLVPHGPKQGGDLPRGERPPLPGPRHLGPRASAPAHRPPAAAGGLRCRRGDADGLRPRRSDRRLRLGQGGRGGVLARERE